MTLTVTVAISAPMIDRPDGSERDFSIATLTFSALVAGIPTPTVQWQDNGVDIPGATNTRDVPKCQFAQDGFVYSIIASNSEGTATNSAMLHVVVPPAIQTQPEASWSRIRKARRSRWFPRMACRRRRINGSSTTSASPAQPTRPTPLPAPRRQNAGTYKVTVANVAGSVDQQQRDADSQFHHDGLADAVQRCDGSVLRHAVVYGV